MMVGRWKREEEPLLPQLHHYVFWSLWLTTASSRSGSGISSSSSSSSSSSIDGGSSSRWP